MRHTTAITHGRLQDANERLARHAADYRAAARALAQAAGETTATVTPPPADAPVEVQLSAMRQATATALCMLPEIRERLDALEERVRATAVPVAVPA